MVIVRFYASLRPMPSIPIRCRSAGVVVVHIATDQPAQYLLLRCFRYWDFPKGEITPDETPLAAAVREVEEETGLSRLIFRWGEVFRETPPYGKNKVARYYMAESPDTAVVLAVNPELGQPEHHEFRWLPYERARALLNARVRDILDWAHALVTDHQRLP